MATDVKSPENLDTQLEAIEDVSQYTLNLKTEVDQAIAARASQFQNYERWYKKRQGIRPPKNFPFPDCANIHLPLVDKSIKKLVPLYTSMIDTPGKVGVFVPAPNNPQLYKAKGEAEIFFSHLVQATMNSHPDFPGFSDSMYLSIDKMAEKGTVVVKIIWSLVSRRVTDFLDIEKEFPNIDRAQVADEQIQEQLLLRYKLDLEDNVDKKAIEKFIKDFRAGKDVIQIRYNKVFYKAPLLIPRDPRNITTPPDTEHLWSARWIDDWFNMTTNDLRIAAKQGKYKQGNVDKYLEGIVEGADSRLAREARIDVNTDTIDQLKHNREGITEIATSKTHKIHETCVWYDIDNDGIEEKCLLTWPDDRPDLYFRLIELPYNHGQWPLIDIPLEISDERWTSPRGVPEHLDHLQTILTARHNFKLDSMSLMNSPVLKTVIGAVNSGNIRLRPGDNLKVSRLDAVEPLVWDRSGLVFEEREEASLKSWAEEYIGLIDHTLSGANNPTQEARTKFELQSVVGEQSRMFGHNGRIFSRRMRKIYEQIWSLWMQYGDEETEIFANGAPLLIRKANFRGDFHIYPATSPETAGIFNEINNAVQDIQLFRGDPMVNQVQLRERYWRARDPMNFDRIVIEPSQLSASQIERQVLELTQMELGFDTPIKPDDEDQAHLQVIQKYLSDVSQGTRQIDEKTLRMVTSHARFHQARLAKLAGQNGVSEKLRTEANQILGLPE